MKNIVFFIFLLIGKTYAQEISENSDSLSQDISTNTFTCYKNKYPLLFTPEFNNSCKCSLDTINTKNLNDCGLCVLSEGYKFAYVKNSIVIGSCWDFANKIYSLAGKNKSKVTIFSSKKNSGKYYNKKLLKPGDWIYHINYEFNNNDNHDNLDIRYRRTIMEKKKQTQTISIHSKQPNHPSSTTR